MQINWLGRGTDGRFRLEAVPGVYDGYPPISTFYIECEPLTVHDDVLAVAGVLLFGEYCSGTLELPRKVSPEVARAIQHFCLPSWVSVSPVELEPRRNPLGEGLLFLTEDIRDMKPRSVWGEPRVSTLVSLSADEFSGSLFSHHGLITNSNARTISTFSAASAVFAQVAIALLFAETFSATQIELSDSLASELEPKDLVRLRGILGSCKIALHTPNTN